MSTRKPFFEDWIVKHYPDRPVYLTKKRSLERLPGAKVANWNAFNSLKGEGRFDEALAQLMRMASFPYEDYRVYREIGMMYRNIKDRPDLAMQFFATSLKLNPDQPALQTILHQAMTESAVTDPKELLPNVQTPQVPGLPEMPGVPGMPELPSMPGARF